MLYVQYSTVCHVLPEILLKICRPRLTHILTELGVALVGGEVGGGDAAGDAVGVPPAALAEAGEPLVPARVGTADPVEDPADLVDVGRGGLEGRRGRRGPRAVLGRRQEDGVELVVVAHAAADVAAAGSAARGRGESSWAKLSLQEEIS